MNDRNSFLQYLSEIKIFGCLSKIFPFSTIFQIHYLLCHHFDFFRFDECSTNQIGKVIGVQFENWLVHSKSHEVEPSLYTLLYGWFGFLVFSSHVGNLENTVVYHWLFTVFLYVV